MTDQDGYPTPDELSDVLTYSGDIHGFLDKVRACLTYEQSLIVTGKRVLRIEFHTFGWSGHEELESVLRQTMFWYFCWAKSTRGGHHWFVVNLYRMGKLTQWGKL